MVTLSKKKRLHALYAFFGLTILGLLVASLLVSVFHFDLLYVFYASVVYVIIIDIPIVLVIAALAKEKTKKESDSDSAV